MTRFQQVNLALGIGLLTLIATLPRAQTFDEAARMNFALATDRCLDVMIARNLPNASFSQAGFAYRGVDRGINSYGVHRGVDHFFDAPAETARATVDAPDRIAGICSVLTTHMPETAAAAIVQQTILRQFPNAQINSPTQWSVRRADGLPLIISTRTIGTNHRYEKPGTVQVSMSYPG